jgi:hypothetical protein
MIDLYVYYKVRELDAAALVPRVRALQDSVGVPSQLKRRPDVRDFPARLDAAARTAGFEGLIEGPRRAEIFMDLPTCA